jgi:hypothetical protein
MPKQPTTADMIGKEIERFIGKGLQFIEDSDAGQLAEHFPGTDYQQGRDVTRIQFRVGDDVNVCMTATSFPREGKKSLTVDKYIPAMEIGQRVLHVRCDKSPDNGTVFVEKSLVENFPNPPKPDDKRRMRPLSSKFGYRPDGTIYWGQVLYSKDKESPVPYANHGIHLDENEAQEEKPTDISDDDVIMTRKKKRPHNEIVGTEVNLRLYEKRSERFVGQDSYLVALTPEAIHHLVSAAMVRIVKEVR